MTKNTITLCTVADDGVEALAESIKALSPIISEVVVVDCSAQNKISAQELGPNTRVYLKPENPDPVAAWNYCISKATGDWILVLEPTERVANGELSYMKHLAINPSYCFEFGIRYYSREWEKPFFRQVNGEYPEFELDYPGYITGNSVRLFPNQPGIYFSRSPHIGVEESIKRMPGLKIVRTRIPLHHYPKRGTEDAPTAQPPAEIPLSALLDQLEAENRQEWLQYFEQGIQHFRSGRLNQSISAFLQCVALKPDHVPAWLNAGYGLLELGHFNEAIEKINEALKVEPGNFEAHCNLGVVHLRKGDFDSAEFCFRKALEINPRHLFSYTNLGAALMHKNMALEAAEAYVQALKLLPQSGSIKADLGAALLAAKQPEEALKYLAEAALDEPRLGRAYYNLAIAYKLTGRRMEAAKAFDQFCEVEGRSHPQPVPPGVLQRIEMASRESAELKRLLKKEADRNEQN